jgi:very-short-patch-repair endonuclease
MSPAERLLWGRLRNGQVGLCHFRRQQIIAGFIVDFYCHAANLIIEVDGPIHLTNKQRDIERDAILQAMGLIMLRFTNDEVNRNLDGVVNEIAKACSATDLTSPPP